MTHAVVVGRFQVPRLTVAHQLLIEAAMGHGGPTLVLLGCTGGQPTSSDPLDYATRKAIIERAYPEVQVGALLDHPSDHAWSASLDKAAGDEATLFCGRDSFRKHYHGHLPIVEAPEIPNESGREARAKWLAYGFPASREEREAWCSGAIHAVSRRFPTSYQAVDVIIREHVGAVLLGRKPGNPLWQFPGGFVDPTDASLEHAAMREAREETNIHIARPRYIGSVRIDDYRYRKGSDKVMSAVFYVDEHGYNERPGDDLEELKWVDPPDVERHLAPSHEVIWQLAKTECT